MVRNPLIRPTPKVNHNFGVPKSKGLLDDFAVRKAVNTKELYIDGTFANIHVHDASAAAQDIPQGATYTKADGFAENGEFSNCTADAANNQIVIKKAGRYYVSHNSSFTGDTNNVTYFVAAFINNVEEDALHFVRKIGTAGDVGSANFSGMCNLSVGDVIDVRVRHGKAATVEYTMEYANLNVQYIGE